MYAQNKPLFEKVVTHESRMDIFSRGLQFDLEGYYYEIGSFINSAKFDNLQLSSSGGVGYLCKYNSSGDLQWAFNSEGNGSSTFIDIAINNKNVFVVGIFSDTLILKQDTLIVEPSNAIQNDYNHEIFIAQFDNNANLKKSIKAFGTGNYNISDLKIACDNKNNIYISGSYRGNVTFGQFEISSLYADRYDIFLAKLNSNFEWEWVQSFKGDQNDAVRGLKVDHNFDIVITGIYRNNLNIDTINIAAYYLGSNQYYISETNIFVAKLNSDGKVKWVNTAGAQGGNSVSSLLINKHNEIVICGRINSWVHFDTILINSRSGLYVAVVSPDGIWKNVLAKEGNHSWNSANNITVDKNEDYYITGHYRSTTADFAFGKDTFRTMSNYDQVYVTKFKIKKPREFEWVWAVNGLATGDSYGYNLAVNENLDLITSGSFKGTITFDSTTLTRLNQSNQSATCVFKLILKQENTNTSISNVFQKGKIKVFPNPFNNEINIKWDNAKSNFSINIYDVQNKHVFHKSNTEMNQNLMEEKIDLNHLNTGLYILQITTDNQTVTYKIIKNQI
jgi:hypothetical protein